MLKLLPGYHRAEREPQDIPLDSVTDWLHAGSPLVEMAIKGGVGLFVSDESATVIKDVIRQRLHAGFYDERLAQEEELADQELKPGQSPSKYRFTKAACDSGVLKLSMPGFVV